MNIADRVIRIDGGSYAGNVGEIIEANGERVRVAWDGRRALRTWIKATSLRPYSDDLAADIKARKEAAHAKLMDRVNLRRAARRINLGL
jgi:hypothetical protein